MKKDPPGGTRRVKRLPKKAVVTNQVISLFSRRKPATKKSALLTEPEPPKPVNAFSRDQPPITRARAWEGWSRVNDDEASELNHELARLFNEAVRQIDQGDRDQVNWYWRCQGELFSLLDTIYLLQVEPSTTPEEAKYISSAVRKHFTRAMSRWIIHQRELRALWV